MQPQYPQYPVPPAGYPQYPQQQPAPYAPPQQGYPGAYYPPQPPPPAPVQGTLQDFFDAPSAGSKAWIFKDRPIGTSYAGIVARPIGKSDIRQQTDSSGRPATYRDGRPKFVMVVPMLVQPTAEFPEGQSSWWVKGQARDELVRAMAEVGAPAGPPEAGAAIKVTLVGMRPIPGMNPAFQYRITYQRPTGAPAQATVEQGTPWQGQPQGPPAATWMNGQPIDPMAPPVQQPPVTQPVPPIAQPTPPPTQPVPPATAPVMAPNTLNAEQQQLLAQLTGG